MDRLAIIAADRDLNMGRGVATGFCPHRFALDRGFYQKASMGSTFVPNWRTSEYVVRDLTLLSAGLDSTILASSNTTLRRTRKLNQGGTFCSNRIGQSDFSKIKPLERLLAF